MPSPGERKIVQSRILACAEDIGLTAVARNVAERRRGFEPQRHGFGKRAATGSVYGVHRSRHGSWEGRSLPAQSLTATCCEDSLPALQDDHA